MNVSFVPFASEMLFELSYDQDCVTQGKKESCFYVLIEYNGLPLEL